MSEPDRLLGAGVVDASGRALGSVSALLVDPGGQAARWLDVALSTGGHAVVPAAVASADASGVLTIPYGLSDLTSAPPTDGPVLTATVAAALLDHYGFPPDGR